MTLFLMINFRTKQLTTLLYNIDLYLIQFYTIYKVNIIIYLYILFCNYVYYYKKIKI